MTQPQSPREFTDEEIRRKGQEAISHIATIHVKAFGSESYKPKTVGELRLLVQVAMKYAARLIEKAENAG